MYGICVRSSAVVDHKPGLATITVDFRGPSELLKVPVYPDVLLSPGELSSNSMQSKRRSRGSVRSPSFPFHTTGLSANVCFIYLVRKSENKLE